MGDAEVLPRDGPAGIIRAAAALALAVVGLFAVAIAVALALALASMAPARDGPGTGPENGCYARRDLNPRPPV